MEYICSFVYIRQSTPGVLVVVFDVTFIDGRVEKRGDVWREVWVCPGLTLRNDLLNKAFHLGKFVVFERVYVAEVVEVSITSFFLRNTS